MADGNNVTIHLVRWSKVVYDRLQLTKALENPYGLQSHDRTLNPYPTPLKSHEKNEQINKY